MTVDLSGKQERLHFFKADGAPIDQFEDPFLPVGCLERLQHNRSHGPRNAVRHLAIECVHVVEVSEHRTPAHLGNVGDLVSTGLGIALGHQLKHGVDNARLALLRAMLASVRLVGRPHRGQSE